MKNLEGDGTQRRSVCGTVLVEYAYDAWGNVLDISGTYASTPGQNNPIRYRGYYYDSGTSLYYLNSRYYDSAVGRFMNADSFDTLIATPKQLTDKNLFTYCDNNPIVRIDEGGEFWNWVIGASVGAIVGVAGQFVSDLVTSALNQKLTFSNWQTYAGAFVGGDVGGAMAKVGGKVIDNLTKKLRKNQGSKKREKSFEISRFLLFSRVDRF